jgi:metallo-beta-lactamase family protein
LLYELEELLDDELPVILDSPLASKFTAAYRELKPFWDDEAHARLKQGRKPLAFDTLLTVDSHHEHLKMVHHLSRSGRPAIVIAGSGMCNAGRIVNYLKAMLGDARHDVLFVGYQAEGTPGRAIQQYGPQGGWVELDNERYSIRARVETIGGYSAHADQQGLVNFVKRIKHKPREIRLVHGDKGAKQALKEALVLAGISNTEFKT